MNAASCEPPEMRVARLVERMLIPVDIDKLTGRQSRARLKKLVKDQ